MSRPAPSRNLTLTEELEKLEQSITLTLQEIDHNFSKAHRIVTTNILPLVEQYGEHSKNVWEASKFWKQFFEASANVSLSGYEELANEDTTAANETTRLTDTTTMSEDREGEAVNESAAEELSYHEPSHRRDAEDSLLDDGSLAGSTPRLPATKSLRGELMQMANFGSPYENLRRELKGGADDGSHTPKSDVFGEGMDDDETARQLQQTRFPEMDMTSNSSIMEASTPTRDIRTNLFGTGGKGKGNSKDPLLHQLLNKNYRIQATPHKTTTQLISPNKGRASDTDKTRKALWQESPMSSPEIAAPTLRTNLYNAASPLKQQRGRLGTGATRLEPPRTPGVSVQTPATGRKTRDVFAGEGTSKSKSKGKGKGKADPDEITWESDEEEDSAIFGGMSPPKTIQFALPPSKLMQTPAKEASKRIVDDILLTAGAAPEYEDDLEDFSPTMVKMSHNILDDSF